MFVVCADEENKCCIDNERKGGRYETKKTRNKAETCRSYGGSYGAVSGECERLGRDEAEETTGITLAENAPQYLYVGDGTTIAVIWDGKLQDDGKDNKNTIYQGNG